MIHWKLFRRIKVYVQLQDRVEGQKVPGHKRLVKDEAAKPSKNDKLSTGALTMQNIFYAMIYGDKTKIMLI